MRLVSRDEQIRESIISGDGVPALQDSKAEAARRLSISDSTRSTRTRGTKPRWETMLEEQLASDDQDDGSIYVVNEMRERVNDMRFQAQSKRNENLLTIVCVSLVLVLALVGTVQFFVDFGNEANIEDMVDAEELGLPFAIPHATYEAIQDESSPQYAAHKWLKEDPQMLSYTPERIKQRLAMAIFYYSTDGQEWAKKEGTSTAANSTNLPIQRWLSYNESECTWFSTVAVEKDNTPVCDANDNLQHLVLIENDLQGTIPDEIGWLTSLKVLDLNGNAIKGTVPTSLGSLPNLEKLSLFHNKLSGGVPSELGLLAPTLQWLIVRENLLTGSFPSELWKLSELELLIVSENEHLAGSFPDDLGALMPNLQELKTTKSSGWVGTLPSSIGSMTALKELHVHHNQLLGPIPPLPNSLVDLKAPNNQLSGSLPEELPVGMQYLDLGGNRELEGTIPSTWNTTSLEELKLWGTSITGTVPDELCSMQVLEFDCNTALCGCDCPCADFAG